MRKLERIRQLGLDLPGILKVCYQQWSLYCLAWFPRLPSYIETGLAGQPFPLLDQTEHEQQQMSKWKKGTIMAKRTMTETSMVMILMRVESNHGMFSHSKVNQALLLIGIKTLLVSLAHILVDT